MNLANPIVLVKKPRGITSHDVVALVRKKTGVKRVGHAGTLDPLAEGLLIVLVGKEATTRQKEFMKLEKEYVATIRLGATSTTDDAEGVITTTNDQIPTHSTSLRVGPERIEGPMTNKIPISKERVERTLKKLIGTIEQVPPAYSAVKVRGKRAYALARKGIKPELKPRAVTIKEIELLSYHYPLLQIRVVCSSGTYIRSLARDIGQKLACGPRAKPFRACGAYLEKLTRTRIGPYRLKDAQTIEVESLYQENTQKMRA